MDAKKLIEAAEKAVADNQSRIFELPAKSVLKIRDHVRQQVIREVVTDLKRMKKSGFTFKQAIDELEGEERNG